MTTPHVLVGNAGLREAGEVHGAINEGDQSDLAIRSLPGLLECHLDPHGDPVCRYRPLDQIVLPTKSIRHFSAVVATARVLPLERRGVSGDGRYRTLDDLLPARCPEVDLPCTGRGDVHLEHRRSPRGSVSNLLFTGVFADEPARNVDPRKGILSRRGCLGEGDEENDGSHDPEELLHIGLLMLG